MQDVESHTPASIDSAPTAAPSAPLGPNESGGSLLEMKPPDSPLQGDALPDIAASDGDGDMEIGQGTLRTFRQHLICSGSTAFLQVRCFF